MSTKLLMIGLAFTLIFSSTTDAKEKKEKQLTPGSAIFVMAPPKSISVTTQTLNESSLNGSIEISYPKLYGLEDLSFQENVNTLLEEQANVSYQKMKQKMLDDKPSIPYHLSRSFSIKESSNKRLTLALFEYCYTGERYGLSTQDYLVIDVPSNKILTLRDLFTLDTYKQQLQHLIRQQMNGQTQRLTLSEDEVFYITQDNHLVLVFNTTDITPSHLGILEVFINKQDLKGYRFN